MNIGEQIKSFENKRAALAASLEEVMTKAAEEGRTLDVEEEEHYDNTAAEIRQVDAHLKRLRELEAGKAATAQPVKQAGNGNVAAVASAPVIRVEQKLDKGIGFACLPNRWLRLKASDLKPWKWPVVSIRMTVVCIMS